MFSVTGLDLMAARITLDEFFSALRRQGGSPVIDTQLVRMVLLRKLEQIGRNYPVKFTWPVADIEFAYEQFLNNSRDQLQRTREFGYLGTVNLKAYDETYTLDEWFDDFRIEYALTDTPEVRQKMTSLLPPGNSWPPARLYQSHKAVTQPLPHSLRERLLG